MHYSDGSSSFPHHPTPLTWLTMGTSSKAQHSGNQQLQQGASCHILPTSRSTAFSPTAPTQGRGHGCLCSQLLSLHPPACLDPTPFPFGRGIDLLAAMGWIISQELGFLLQPGGCPSWFITWIIYCDWKEIKMNSIWQLCAFMGFSEDSKAKLIAWCCLIVYWE